MKRFWSTATAVGGADGFYIELDAKPLRVPGGAALRVPGERLARAIADEWQAAPAVFTAEDLPLTRLAGTAQERIAPDPRPTAAAIARHGESDLLCYRADRPAALAERQARLWQPWLDWAESRYEARLLPTTGIVHLAQDPAALARLSTIVHASDATTLAGLGVLVPALGSLVLGLAVVAGDLAAPEAHGLACLDELFQEESWGEDHVAVQRRAQVGADIVNAARFVVLAHA